MINLIEELKLQIEPNKLQFYNQASDELVRKQMTEDISVVQKPQLNLDIGAQVILNNIPKITEDKKEKLLKVLASILTKLQINQDMKDLKINLSGQGLITFINDEAAQLGASILNGFSMGANNTIQAFTIKDFNNILQTPDNYASLNLKTKKELQLWLTQPDHKNQIIYLQDRNKLSMDWFTPLQGTLDNIVKEQTITNTERLEWSKNGTYLVLYTEDGFQLLGGHLQNFQVLHQFKHQQVKQVTFSQNEELMISFNGTSIETESTENYILWKVREELKLRTFRAEQLDGLDTFQFSSNNELLARIDNNLLIFYKGPIFFQFKKPYKAISVQNFIWVEKTDFICYACYTGSQRENDKNIQKSSIMFYNVQTEQSYRWRVISNESDGIELFSNTNGRWVIAIIKKKIKRKVVSTLVQVANVKKWDNNLEVVNEEVQDEYDRVFVEPRTGKIALCVRDKNARASQAFNFSFFVIDETKSIDLKPAGTFLQRDTNEVMWSNSGTYFAFVNNLKGSPDQGKIEFAMVTKKISNNNEQISYNIEITKSTNHFYMSHAFWDPSGIYFVTMSDQWNSVIIWSAIGEQLYRNTISKITYINWRAKPINILSEKEESHLTLQSIQKEYLKKYEQEDDKIINKAKHDRETKRENMKNQFEELMKKKKQQWKDARKQRQSLLGFDADDKSQLISIEIIEREEIVNEQQA